MDNRNKKSENDKKKGANPRIVTMDSIRNSQEESERQAYFAGGSEHSGQQILGRGKRRNEQDSAHLHESGEALAAAFRRASSSSHSGESRTLSFHQGPQSFGGIGHRLGDTESPNAESEVTPTRMQVLDPENPAQVVLTLWENGYNIDNGPLQSYEDPRCAELMANIDRGELPTNLLPNERPGPVHLSVVDKRAQKYKESVKLFGGKGHKLGSPTPHVSATETASTSKETSPNVSSELSEQSLTIDVNDQSTSLNNSGNESFKNLMDSLVFLRKRRGRPLNMDEETTAEDVIFEDEEETSSSDDIEFVANEESNGVFGGQGHVLEGAENVAQSVPAPQEPNCSGGSLSVEGEIDFSQGAKQTTMLKIRLPDGQTMQITVNANCTISQLKDHIRQCIQSLSNVNFTLHLTYPRRELRDDESVNSSDINMSVLVLRY